MARTKQVANPERQRRREIARARSTVAKKCTKSVPSDPAKTRKARRFKPGTVALREIRKQQKSTEQVCSKRGFNRLVRDIASDFMTNPRMKQAAPRALQEAAEGMVIEMMENSNLAAIHAKRVTIMPKDVKLVNNISGFDSKFN